MTPSLTITVPTRTSKLKLSADIPAIEKEPGMLLDELLMWW